MGALSVIDLRGEGEPDVAVAVDHLRAGGVLAYPTETVYGLGGACSLEGVAAVRRLKGREPDKPLLALIASATDADGLRWTAEARELASIFWPGSVTLVLDDPDRIFPDGIRSLKGTVGLRVSPHPLVSVLLKEYGAPLTSTSLNVPGEMPVSSGSEAREVLVRLGADGAVLLDVGTLPASAPSTVVDCTGRVPVVLREGSVPTHRLRCAIPEIHGNRID